MRTEWTANCTSAAFSEASRSSGKDRQCHAYCLTVFSLRRGARFKKDRQKYRAIRQKFALRNSKENFADSKSARFQWLSTSIGRFSIEAATNRDPLSAGERPSPKGERSV
jgi:hypothetical protein